MGIVEETAAYAREAYSAADWPHITDVVTQGRWLAKQTGADEEVVTLAAYLHDISRATMGPQGHNVQSAQMAREWLHQRGYPAERTRRVAQAIVAHMRPVVGPERESVSLEERILYDADKIHRAQGIGLLGALVCLGKQVPWEELGYEQLAEAVQRGRDVTEEAYGTLYTDAARERAGPGYERTLEFCDALLEMQVFQSEADP
jgi:HD superfamily phosphodiesterase